MKKLWLCCSQWGLKRVDRYTERYIFKPYAGGKRIFFGFPKVAILLVVSEYTN
jgi:hypothetical protein